jgi:hypothetical protein
VAIQSGTWRSHPFNIGQGYVARKRLESLPSGVFVVGQAYRLKHVAHSHYDGCTVFTFEAPSGEQIQWWWSDEQPESLCAEYFDVPGQDERSA